MLCAARSRRPRSIAASGRGAPFAAADTVKAVLAHRPDAELLALWLADAVLARRLGWPLPVPLLAAALLHPSLRTAGRRPHPADPGWTQNCCAAYALAAAQACDLHAELGRRAAKLLAAVPQLRAKGRGSAVIETLLAEDAVLPSGRGGSMSDRAPPAAVRSPGLSRRGARTDRTRDVPALRAVTMARTRSKKPKIFDRELTDLPNPLRRREFMMRIEAVLFASPRPVSRETLSSLIGGDSHLDQLIADIREELRARPYELVAVAGGFAYRTRPAYADVIWASGVVAATTENLSPLEGLVVTVVGYFQPITRAAICDILGKPVSRDILSVLRRAGLIAAGPRSPQPGAPVTYVTTKAFLDRFGLDSLRDLPDFDRLEEAGLLGTVPLPDELRSALGITDAEPGAEADEDRGDDEDEKIAAVEE